MKNGKGDNEKIERGTEREKKRRHEEGIYKSGANIRTVTDILQMRKHESVTDVDRYTETDTNLNMDTNTDRMTHTDTNTTKHKNAGKRTNEAHRRADSEHARAFSIF